MLLRSDMAVLSDESDFHMSTIHFGLLELELGRNAWRRQLGLDAYCLRRLGPRFPMHRGLRFRGEPVDTRQARNSCFLSLGLQTGDWKAYRVHPGYGDRTCQNARVKYQISL